MTNPIPRLRLPLSSRVQDVFSLPTFLPINLPSLFSHPIIGVPQYLVCQTCKSKYTLSCPVCNFSQTNSSFSLHTIQNTQSGLSKEFKDSKGPVPMIIVVNTINEHMPYVNYFLTMLSQFDRDVLLILPSDTFCVIPHPSREIILTHSDTLLVNLRHHTFSSRLMNATFISERILNQKISPTNDLTNLITELASELTHIVIFTSDPLALPKDIQSLRNNLYHSSSTIDQFVFNLTPRTCLAQVFSKDTNGYFCAYDKFSIVNFPSDCERVIKSQKIYNLRIVAIMPGVLVENMTPKSFTYSTDQTITLFLKTKDNLKENVRAQFQFNFVHENGCNYLGILNETFETTNRLQQLFSNYDAADFLAFVAKYAIHTTNGTVSDARNKFMTMITQCFFNFYDISHTSQFPYNRDTIGYFCCHILNSPSFNGDEAESGYEDSVLVKCLMERNFIVGSSTQEIAKFYDKDLYYVKLVSEDERFIHVVNVPYQTERFVGQEWLIHKYRGVATHLIFKTSKTAQHMFGPDWLDVGEEELENRWKEIMKGVSNDPAFFEPKLKSVKHKINIVGDYSAVLPFCYDGMPNRYRDPALFKINLIKKIEETKKRNETTYLFPHV
ncbi:hypothetical protein EIN_403880 [Entamoeba invadens IP1]|uniref:Uncharacterized protein n=1 Tax=Entamoeba invadens IP1 TaxID=370355 RepID=A0A0A1UCM5_ENTIV|nr:hypothetical protein EIN_403880 [Entamoeba invadens IP1]ELP90044.1 hypothetical protein EIN_403880 [Entamoeba invadens IP1]|eukprot:XP_004256815.1 hypothetical protein EIN_403880 [Entamoeba invadens IP1]